MMAVHSNLREGESMRDQAITAVALLTVVITSGCSSNPRPYPADWPALTEPPAQGCADITGTYKAEAARSLSGQQEEKQSAPTLDSLLTREIQRQAPDRVELSMPDAFTLRVLGLREGKPVVDVRLDSRKDEWNCRARAPETGGTRLTRENIAGVESQFYAFRKDAAGNLVARESSSATGCAMCLVPFSFRDVQWFVYQPVKGE